MRILSILFLFILLQSCSNHKNLKANQVIQAKTIIRQIESGEHVYYENKSIEGELDFTKLQTQYRKGSQSYVVEIPVSITLVNCELKSKITGFFMEGNEVKSCHFQKNLSLINCTINEELDLRESSFEGSVDFSRSNFKMPIRMEGVRYRGMANFNNCIFLKEARFQNSTFEWKSNFMESQFAENMSFQGSRFKGNTQFSSIRCSKYADFTLTHFQQEVFFSYAKFDGRLVFGDTHFNDRVDFIKTEFSAMSLKNVWFNNQSRFNSISAYSDILWEDVMFLADSPEISFSDSKMMNKLKLKNVSVRKMVELELEDLIKKSDE